MRKYCRNSFASIIKKLMDRQKPNDDGLDKHVLAEYDDSNDFGLRSGMKSSEKIASIEALRVGVILLLILYHCALMNETSGKLGKLFVWIASCGWIGTDIFLALSGYLCVCSIYTPQGYRVNYLSFLTRRCSRIFPSFFVFIFSYLYLVPVLIDGDSRYPFLSNIAHTREFIPSFITFSFNIPMANGNWPGSALEGLFAIALGVQLTIVVGWMLCNWSVKRILCVLAAMEVLTFYLRIENGIASPWWAYFHTFGRLDAFIGGVSCALLAQNERIRIICQRFNKQALVVFLFSLAVIAIGTHGLNIFVPRTTVLAYPVIALFAVSLVYYVINITNHNRIIGFLSKFGVIVYAIYLIKLPLLYFVKYWLESNQIVDNTVSMGLFIVIGTFCCFLGGAIWWICIENPAKILVQFFLKRFGGGYEDKNDDMDIKKTIF